MNSILNKQEEYIVALRYTKAAGAYANAITWTNWKTKENFDEWFNGQPEPKQQVVVEEGITAERAVELVKTTPLLTHLAVAVERATDRETGKIDPKRARMELLQLALVDQLLHPEYYR